MAWSGFVKISRRNSALKLTGDATHFLNVRTKVHGAVSIDGNNLQDLKLTNISDT